MPIKTIASDCGYSVVNNFYRDFKSIYGTSPMQMRLSHKETICTIRDSRSQVRTRTGQPKDQKTARRAA